MLEFDFFETPVLPYTVLVEGAEVTIHVRNAETMEQGAVQGIVSRRRESLGDGEVVRLNCYGRLGVRISDEWYMRVTAHLEDDALTTDHIVAREGTITGSIGVILQTTDVTGMLGKLGISTEAIKSAPLKAAPSPLEPLTDEARAATRSLVMDMYGMFVDMVADRRQLERARALALADGRVYTGRQAKAAGLIDDIGGEAEARDWLASHGVPNNLPVRELKIEREDRWSDWVTGMASALTGKTYLSERLKLDGLVAVWHPDLRVQ